MQRGVVIEHIVANHGTGHGVAHCLRGLRDRVAPEINVLHIETLR